MSMTLDDLIFINNLPTLDLHGLDEASAKVMISDFIYDNKKKKHAVTFVWASESASQD